MQRRNNIIQYRNVLYEFKRLVLCLKTKVHKCIRRLKLFDGGCCYSYLLLFFNTKSYFKTWGKHLIKENDVIVFIGVRLFWEKMIKLLILCSLYCLHTCVLLNFIYLLFQKMLRSQCLCTCIYLTLSFCKKKML